MHNYWNKYIYIYIYIYRCIYAYIFKFSATNIILCSWWRPPTIKCLQTMWQQHNKLAHVGSNKCKYNIDCPRPWTNDIHLCSQSPRDDHTIGTIPPTLVADSLTPTCPCGCSVRFSTVGWCVQIRPWPAWTRSLTRSFADSSQMRGLGWQQRVVAPTTPTGHTHKHYQPNLHNTVVPNWKYVNPRDIFVAELTLVIWTCMVQQKNKLFRYNTCILVGCEDMSCCHACLCLGGSMQ